MLPEFIISADLGQSQDYTAIATLERTERPTGRMHLVPPVAGVFGGGEPQRAGHYDVVDLQRLPLGTPYTALPAVLERIATGARRRWLERCWEEEVAVVRAGRSVASHPTLDDAPLTLIVDGTGVGAAVVDFLHEAGLDPISLMIHGGDSVVRPDSHTYRVPKRDLAGVVQMLLQTRRLQWADALPEAATLKAELRNFRSVININTGHDSYGAGPAEAWREGAHDDLVLSIAMGCWFGEYGVSRPVLDPLIVAAWQW